MKYDFKYNAIPEEFLGKQVGNLLDNKNNKMIKYSFWKGLWKSAISLFLVLTPIILQVAPNQYLDITIGGVLLLAVNWAKVKYKNM